MATASIPLWVAVVIDQSRAELGVAALRGLDRSALLQAPDQSLVASILRVVAAAEYDGLDRGKGRRR